MSVSGTGYLARRMCRFRWRAVLVVLLAGMITAGSVVLLASIRASVMGAVSDGVVANRGYGSGYVFQATDPADATLLNGLPNVTPVAVTTADVSTRRALASATIRVQGNSRAPIGHLLTGSRPSGAHAATVSHQLAAALGASIGDRITVALPSHPRQLTISGITVDPADRAGMAAALVQSNLAGLSATQWITPAAPTARNSPDVVSRLNSHAILASSTRGAVLDAQDNPPPVASTLRHVPTGIGVLLVLLTLAMVATMRSTVTRDVRALAGAGVPQRRAWRVVSTGAAGVGTLGAALGIALAVLTMMLFRQPISEPFGQWWIRTVLPAAPIVVMLLLPAALTLAARPIVSAGSRAIPWLARSRNSRGGILVISGAGLAGGVISLGLAWWQRHHLHAGHPTLLAFVGLTLLAAALPVVLASIARTWARTATRRVVRHVGNQFVLTAVIGLVVATVAGGYAALTIQDLNTIGAMSSGPQPDGSLVIDGLSKQTAEKLTNEYHDLGGTDIGSYDIADARHGQPRATSPDIAHCVTEGSTLDACSAQFPEAGLNVIAFSEAVPRGTAYASPRVLRNGRTAIVLFEPGTSRIVDTSEVAAQEDGELGGNLPALVLSANEPFAAPAGLHGSGVIRLALLDFGDLPASSAAQFRAAVARLAPAAPTIGADAQTGAAQERGLARTVALTSAGVVFVIVLLGASAVLANTRRLRVILAAGGATKLTRLVIGARIFSTPAAAAILSALLIPIAISSASVFGSAATLGTAWLAPFGAAAVAGLLAVFTFITVPNVERRGT